MAFGDVRRHSTGYSGTRWPPTRVIIRITDMTEEMQKMAVNTASDALESCHKLGDVAAFIKKSFDVQLYSGWMCVVGQSFGSQVTHQIQHYIYFFIRDLAILLWKCD
ncbi:dynein light chain [Echinococcus multilocularis]|uniref:Dynein light chain n=1 Tax=Echinococcus multilocularis TaxID=6211 RepID=A0A068YEN8_ECHMU|nr:dynein light chain [Echinococcus multilocularis]